MWKRRRQQIALINNGRLLMHADPDTLLQTVNGEVWDWAIPNEHFSAIKKRYMISSTVRRGNGLNVRVVNKGRPGETAVPVTPTMEDAYLYAIGGAS